MGIGVTAFSEADAFALIESKGFDEWFEGAAEIRVERGVRIRDLDQSNIASNIGPMQLRGVWYPAANVGIGAPRDKMYKRLHKEGDD